MIDMNKLYTAKKNFSWKSLLLNNAIFVLLLLLLMIIVVVDPSFLQLKNFAFILEQSSTRVILALGVAGILVLGGTDLSVGRMVGVAAVVSTSLLQSVDYSRRIYSTIPELPLFLPILVVVIITSVFAALNGIIVAKLKVTAFITTLGMSLILYGLASFYFEMVGASPIAGLDPKFTEFAQGSFNIFGVNINYILCYAIVISCIIWFIWNKTRIGKNMFAVGGNSQAASVSGVNVDRTIILVFMMAGVLYGFAGSLEAARTGSATNNMGNMYELDAIAACVVGGVSLNGGVGSIPGVIMGVLIFQIISYGLVYISVNPYLQYIIKGIIIIIAVAIDTQKYLKRK